jgi:hypothetical protein
MVSPPEGQPPKHRFAHQLKHLCANSPSIHLCKFQKGWIEAEPYNPNYHTNQRLKFETLLRFFVAHVKANLFSMNEIVKIDRHQNQRFSSRVQFNHLGTSSPFQNK